MCALCEKALYTIWIEEETLRVLRVERQEFAESRS